MESLTSEDSVLLVGDGNFTFARALQKRFKLRDIVASDLKAVETNRKASSKVLEQLRALGVVVLHGFDATSHSAYKRVPFHPTVIVFNFPHTGVNQTSRPHEACKANRELVSRFFAAVPYRWRGATRILVTVKGGQHYDSWEVDTRGDPAGWLCEESSPFDSDLWQSRGYRHTATTSTYHVDISSGSTYSFKHQEARAALCTTAYLPYLIKQTVTPKKPLMLPAPASDEEGEDPTTPTSRSISVKTCSPAGAKHPDARAAFTRLPVQTVTPKKPLMLPLPASDEEVEDPMTPTFRSISVKMCSPAACGAKHPDVRAAFPATTRLPVQTATATKPVMQPVSASGSTGGVPIHCKTPRGADPPDDSAKGAAKPKKCASGQAPPKIRREAPTDGTAGASVEVANNRRHQPEDLASLERVCSVRDRTYLLSPVVPSPLVLQLPQRTNNGVSGTSGLASLERVCSVRGRTYFLSPVVLSPVVLVLTNNGVKGTSGVDVARIAQPAGAPVKVANNRRHQPEDMASLERVCSARDRTCFPPPLVPSPLMPQVPQRTINGVKGTSGLDVSRFAQPAGGNGPDASLAEEPKCSPHSSAESERTALWRSRVVNHASGPTEVCPESALANRRDFAEELARIGRANASKLSPPGIVCASVVPLLPRLPQSINERVDCTSGSDALRGNVPDASLAGVAAGSPGTFPEDERTALPGHVVNHASDCPTAVCPESAFANHTAAAPCGVPVGRRFDPDEFREENEQCSLFCVAFSSLLSLLPSSLRSA
ncbi:hypothetical protein DIPPA_23094 [Diplonema papillatum]|nr:hypothetical protein DIPPA_23094 [Diplonema papillatum]